MKTKANKPNKFLLAGCMFACLTAGWFLGSITDGFSQSAATKQNSINLPSISMNGESLPTVILTEYAVVAPTK